jgi:hypothetical protein
MAWWQATRALSGNTLSWAYTFEWPVFAGYALYMWWKLLHDEDTGGHLAALPAHGAATEPVGTAAPSDQLGGHDADPSVVHLAPGVSLEDDEDVELAAYNDYLAALSASGRRKRW